MRPPIERSSAARALLSFALLLAVGCAGATSSRPPPLTPARAAAPTDELTPVSPEARGMDPEPLLDLATWIRDRPVPIYSLLISRGGDLVFELTTSGLGRDEAHYMMSVTKSVVSTLVGIAIDRRLLPTADASIADLVAPGSFPKPEDRERFARVTLKDVMAMSALDALDPPRSFTPEAVARQRDFLRADCRLCFALSQSLLPEPGVSFQYNDLGPQIVTGLLKQVAREAPLAFAERELFGPLGFEGYEWMHRDPSGADNGGYGLRLRPIDMQKLGLLYLRKGVWKGRRVVSSSWIDASFTPFVRSSPKLEEPDYGWFWWAASYGARLRAHEARGWKGQRIAVFPEEDLVVTMTGYVEDGSERALFDRVIEDYVAPSLRRGARARPPREGVGAELAAVLDEVRRGPLRGPQSREPRMIPSKERKEPLR